MPQLKNCGDTIHGDSRQFCISLCMNQVSTRILFLGQTIIFLENILTYGQTALACFKRYVRRRDKGMEDHEVCFRE